MRSLAAAVLALTLATVLAGCSSDNGDGTSPSPTATAPGGTRSGTGSPSPGANVSARPDNHPPSAGLTFKAFRLQVNFSATSQDADGDKLTGTLAFGDSSTQAIAAFPAALNHTYAKAGVYNATLTVSDGTTTRTSVVKLTLDAGPLKPAYGAHYDETLVTPMPIGDIPEDKVLDAVHEHPQANGTSVVWYELTTDATTKTLSGIEATKSPSCVDVDMYVKLPDGTYNGDGASGNKDETFTIKNPAPGAYTVFVVLWAGAACDLGVDLAMTY